MKTFEEQCNKVEEFKKRYAEEKCGKTAEADKAIDENEKNENWHEEEKKQIEKTGYKLIIFWFIVGLILGAIFF